MSKIRVHELAKRLAIDNKSVLNALKKIGVTGKSHSSSLEDHIVQKVKRVLLGYEVEPEPAPETTARKKRAKAADTTAKKVVRRRAANAETDEAVKAEEEEAAVTVTGEAETVPEEAKAESPEEKAPDVEPAKPVKKAEKKVVISLAEMQAAAAMLGKEAVSKLEDLPKIKETISKAAGEHALTRAERKLASELGINAEELKKSAAAQEKDEIDKDELLAEKLAKPPTKDKLKKFKGKAFQTMEQVQVAGRASGSGPSLQPSFPRGRGRRRPVKGRRGMGPQVAQMRKGGPSTPSTAPRRKDIKFREGATVKEFSELIGQKMNEVIKKLMELGQMATANQPMDADAAQLLAEGFGVGIEVIPIETEASMLEEVIDDKAALVDRAPVVTVMGHVDHGKTSLLDAIRQTRVTEGEAGGITQHIGAYSVQLKGRNITFLDTPGHAAFTAMRARGAKVTDVVILVVAADDGVMPQTIEAVDHAKAAGVPIVVAVNKIDKHGANPDKVKAELAERGLTPEEWGGDTVFCEVSAKQKIGIEHLLEMVLLQSDVLELKANPDRPAQGTVVEARLDKGRGPVATMLVQTGTLHSGDIVLTGTLFGKVRALNDDTGKKINSAGPSIPVEVVGLSGVPGAGDTFMVVEDERKARQVAMTREEKLKAREMAQRAKKAKVSLEDLFTRIQEGEVKDLNILVKGDVQGSVEAVRDSLVKITHPEVKITVIHALPGGITESDVMLANASDAIIIGFNVRPDPKAAQLADAEGVDIRLYSVIYQAVDDVKQAMEGMLAPTLEEKVLGRAEVRQTFHVSRIGTIAGSYVLDGVISRSCTGIRVIRDNVVIYDGKLGSLKRFQEDTKEVATGYECGITVQNFNDIKVGDVLENYLIESFATKLE